MSAPRTDSKWWGWGAYERQVRLSRTAEVQLREELELAGDADSAVLPPIEEVQLPDPRALPAEVVAAAGAEHLSAEPEQRVRHAAGKSYPDLIRLRSGRLEQAPDAVISPGDRSQLAAVLAACTATGVAVVPFGGGTSVVGGVDPHRGAQEPLVALDLHRMGGVEVDATSLTARLGPGLRGPEAEAGLTQAGVTLGHFPQSFEYATIGGFAATRSAGQASAGYGRFDELVTSLEMVAPNGAILSTRQTPHTAAGPSLRQLVLGSEGTLGVISSVTVRVRPAPREKRYEAWFAEDFVSGAEIIRELAQEGLLPDVTRLSDEEESHFSLMLSIGEGAARHALNAYLSLRRRSGGCMMIVGWEGQAESVARRRALGARALRRGGAVPLGRGAGRAWEGGRFDGPYLRDELLDRGVLVETLETSHTWSRLHELYGAVTA
ncbi:MAG: FAD-binding oxidoreductase, partial [Solirubrobacterales bacterium]